MANKKAETVKIKLVKSLIGATEAQKRIVRSLGLSRKDQVVEHASIPTIMGMVNKVPHLVQIVK